MSGIRYVTLSNKYLLDNVTIGIFAILLNNGYELIPFAKRNWKKNSATA
jgi:hypothetical protein